MQNALNGAHEPERSANGLLVVQITPAQLRKWEECVSMATYTAPGFLHLLYKLLNAQNNTTGLYVCIFSEDVETAATDGINIIVNPAFFLDLLTLAERFFVLCHEIMHNVYGDVQLLHRCRTQGYVLMPEGDKLEFVNPVMQIAMDYRINALLIESKLGKPPKAGAYDKTVRGNDSVYPIYRRLLAKHQKEQKQQQQQGKPCDDGKPQPGNRDGNNPPRPNQGKNEGQQFDDLLKPGQATAKPAQEAVAERSEERWHVELEIAKQLEIAHRTTANGIGKLPGALAIMFEQLLTPETDWRDHMAMLVKKVTGDGSVNWYEPNPYLGHNEYFVPAETGEGAGWVAIWGDTSGSVNNPKVQAKYISEMAGLMEQVSPKRLTVIWADTKVQHVDEFTDGGDLRTVTPKGGGGTSYGPVIDWIRDNGNGEYPDVMIAFTDGIVNHVKQPPYPVIWACNTDSKFPWGQVVRINDKKGA